MRSLISLAIALLFGASVTAAPEVRYAPAEEVLALFTKTVRPEYPYEARRSRMTGRGIFRLYIDKDGKVRRVGVMKSTGHEILDVAAAAGLARWEARPGKKQEVDMPVMFTIGSW